MQSKGRKKIRAVANLIVREYRPEKIILFGSQARGEADVASDFDLIIIKKTKKRFLQRLLDVPLLPVPGDIFVYTPEEFARMQEHGNPFLAHALQGAKVIYEKA